MPGLQNNALRLGSKIIASFAIGLGSSAIASCPSRCEARSPLDELRAWREDSDYGRLNRQDASAVSPERRVIVVIGLTGAGKSSTCNTLAGRVNKQFITSSSVTSVTAAASQRDYDFVKAPWRVVDTPGLGDTNRDRESVRGELTRIAQFAPHGVTGFIVVVPRGRFTGEHEAALRDLEAHFGAHALRRFAVIAVTGATDPASESRGLLSRDTLVDEINALPLNHFFRNFVRDAQFRIVPVENRFDPHRQVSRMSLHQRVLDVEKALDGERFDLRSVVSAESFASASSRRAAIADRAASLDAALRGALATRCSHAVMTRKEDGKLVLRTDCELSE
jgi:hypothetical protein